MVRTRDFKREQEAWDKAELLRLEREMKALKEERDKLKQKAELALQVPELEELGTRNQGLKNQINGLKERVKSGEALIKESQKERDEALVFKKKSAREGAQMAFKSFKNAIDPVKVMHPELDLSFPNAMFVVREDKIIKPVKGAEPEIVYPASQL